MVRTVFTGGDVFDGTGAVVSRADVAIEDERIVAVGDALDGDNHVDCSGKTLLPGLIDTHVHLTIGAFDMNTLAAMPFSYQFFAAAVNLKNTLAVGVTTVRDAGGADLGVKRAVDNGLIPGPRVKIAISAMSQTGGHGDGRSPSGAHSMMTMPYPGRPEGIADGPDEVRKLARELLKNGADQLKVCSTGGVGSPNDDPRHSQFTLEELTVIVAEASAQGKYVMSHAQGTQGIKNAIRAGVRSIEHGVYLDDEAIGMMLDAGTWLVPTLAAPLGILKAVEGGAAVPEQVVRKAHDVVEIHAESVSRAIAAGVRIAMGTDSGITPHGQNLQELSLLVDRGMTPAQAIIASTSSAADLMGIGEDLGRIQEGHRADLVVIDGGIDVISDLASRISAVWKDGRLTPGVQGAVAP